MVAAGALPFLFHFCVLGGGTHHSSHGQAYQHHAIRATAGLLLDCSEAVYQPVHSLHLVQSGRRPGPDGEVQSADLSSATSLSPDWCTATR